VPWPPPCLQPRGLPAPPSAGAPPPQRPRIKRLNMMLVEVRTLFDTFHGQIESYKSPSYNETQLRRDFLDKFIKILGWDVNNEKVYHESFRPANSDSG
jgi:hypothetical protein